MILCIAYKFRMKVKAMRNPTISFVHWLSAVGRYDLLT